ncbi:MAG: flagellar filament capping protein FliD [Bacteroidetes bacterium]|nr:flagellar filament capping protein FliD [Bacteroidota bacterium]
MASVSSTSNTLVDQYIQAYISTQEYRYTALDTKYEQLQLKQDFFTQLNSRLNSMLSAMDRFGAFKNVTTGEDEDAVIERKYVPANNIESQFVTRKVVLSQSDYISASANGNALTGLSNVKVLQLATTDSYIGARVDITKTDDGDGNMVGALSDELKANLVDGKGNVKFEINGKEVSVEYAEDDTNEDVMKKIVNTLNKDSDINDKVNVAFIKDTDGTARLTFTAKKTGAENAISIKSTSDEASFLGIGDGSRNEYQDGIAGGGFIAANTDDLNSKIRVNGITITRGSNTIDDAIDGVTLNLKKVHDESDAPTTLDTQIDTDAVIRLLDPLIQAFNSISSFVIANKTAHGNDASMVGLASTLRGLVSTNISAFDNDIPEGYYTNEDTKPIKYLAELGFKVGSDGVLSLADPSKIAELLQTDDGAKLISDAIQGFNEKLGVQMEALVSRDNKTGLVQSRLSSISQQIDSNNKKYEQVEKSVERLAEAQRKQYTAYLSAYYNAQNQAALLSVFSYSGSAYDNLVAQQQVK